MGELLASKVIIQEETPSFRTVATVPTGTGATIGIFEKGPIGEATLVTSFAEFSKIFGGDITAGVGTQSVRGFFENGGQRIYVTRTAHYSDLGNAVHTAVAATRNLLTTTAAASAGTVLGSVVGPFNVNNGDTLSIGVDGGGPTVSTIAAIAANRTGTIVGPYAFTNLWSLSVAVDGGAPQAVVFNTAEFVAIGAATAAEVAAVINAETVGCSATVVGNAVRITSDSQGTGSSIVVADVTGTPGATLGIVVGTYVPGSGDCVDVNQMTVAEFKTMLEADVAGITVTDDGGAVRITSNTTGPSSNVQVVAASTADDELGFDNATHSGAAGTPVATLQVDGKYPGIYGNRITIKVATATQQPPDAELFNLSVLIDGLLVENWSNLTMDDASNDYVEKLVNAASGGSRYIVVTDLDVFPNSPLQERPANGTSAALTGGDDGLAALADTDFIGLDGAGGKTGLRTFDRVSVNILFVADRPTNQVHNAMLTYAEITKNKELFCVLDAPAGMDRSAIVTYVETTAAVLNFSEFGAFYWPQIKIGNPSVTVFGDVTEIVIPPSGHIAGMYARNDGARVGGIYDPPAGVERGRLFGVIGFEDDAVLEEATRDIVFPKRINPITRLPGQPIAVDGSRTLKGGGNFPFVAERRGVIFIQQSIKAAIEYARNSNNDRGLRDSVNATITGFLVGQMNLGAFRTKNKSTAFFVDTSDALNPPSEIFAGRMNIRIGLATQKPAEYIIVSFSQDTRALDRELSAGT